MATSSSSAASRSTSTSSGASSAALASTAAGPLPFAPQATALVWDLGATNQTVCLVSLDGRILASKSVPTPLEETPDGLIWPLEVMHGNFCRLTRELLSALPAGPGTAVSFIAGLGISTFGVCWAPVDAAGALTYPVISWKCRRTLPLVESAEMKALVPWLYERTGAPPMYFNSLFSLLWMRRNRPEALDKAHSFLFMPQLFVQRLTGAFACDRAMATTSMLVNLRTGNWDETVFQKFDLPNKFPVLEACSKVVGRLHAEGAKATGLPEGLPVINGGHDTVVGTACLGRPLQGKAYLSTGTWNLLVAGAAAFAPHPKGHEHSLAWQLNPMQDDPLSGYNQQGLMIGGLALDFVKGHFAATVSFRELDAALADLEPGAKGLRYIPNVVPGSGPYPKAPGALVGFSEGHRPEDYHQAALEGLAFMVHRARELMGIEIDELLVGGGLSKSPTFLRILSAMLGIQVSAFPVAETTSLGVSALVFAGLAEMGKAEAEDPESSGAAAMEAVWALRREAWSGEKPLSFQEGPDLQRAYEAVIATYRKLAEGLVRE